MANEILNIDGIECYEQDGTAYLKLEAVARGLGFTDVKDGNEYIRWNRVEKYLTELNFATCGETSIVNCFIPENIFYRLAMKAKNGTAEAFQAKVADEIIPSIRRTGYYSIKHSRQNDENKRKNAEARLMNARTRMSDQFLKLMKVDTLSKEYKNILVAKAAEILAGEPVISLPKSRQKTYSAKEIGELFDISANKVGRIANLHGLKVSEYGEYYRSKSEYSNKEVDTWVYYDSVIPVFAQILGKITA